MTSAEESALISAAFAAAQQIWNLVENAKSGAISPADAMASLQALQTSLGADNTAADAALDAKFPTG